MSFIWTDENFARATKLYLGGMSCTQVAEAIGAPSRNSVIGKLSRKGVRRPEQAKARMASAGLASKLASRSVRKPPAAKQPRQSLTITQERKAVVRAALANGEAIPPYAAVRTPPVSIAVAPRPWITRQARECAFPVDGEGADIRSCCNPTDGRNYCAQHWRLCYFVPTQSQREAQRNTRVAA